MVVIAIWDSYTKAAPPVLSAGYDQSDALNNNALCEAFLDDTKGRFFITAFKAAPIEI